MYFRLKRILRKAALKAKVQLYVSQLWRKTTLMRDVFKKKKLADLRTLSQLSLPRPPPSLGPIRTNINWDIF